VLRAGVGFRIDGNGTDAHAARGGGDTAGDFATVGDEDLGEHVVSRFYVLCL
jgi:hypothetical protein